MMARVALCGPVSAREFAAFAEAQNWELEGSVAPDWDRAEEYVWQAGDDLFVHWIDDPVIHRIYVMISGPDSTDAERRVRNEFEAYTLDEVKTAFTEALEWPERVETLSIVGAAAPQEFDDRIYETIASALIDTHHAVRHKATLTVFYARWKEFLPILRTMAAFDPDEEVRRVAGVAVQTVENPGMDPYPH
jgi:hypothetical protein